MRIAMVSEHASPLAALGGPDAGGQNVYVARLADLLAERGHEVTVYTRREDATSPDRVPLPSGAVVEHVRAGPDRYVPKDRLLAHMPHFGGHVARAWRHDRPDVVHAHFWMSGLVALMGTHGLGVPVVQTYHALGTVKRRHQGKADTSPPERLEVERTIGASCARILATCSDEVDELELMGVARDRCSVVPCGVDTEHFSARGRVALTPARRARHRLLVVGRLVPRKGVDLALKALQRIPDAELVVAGGPPVDGLLKDPEAVRLLGLARRLRVADRLVLLGCVPHEEMPALIRSADIVLCTPVYEPFGIVPLEAMACGVPVVATDVGGHRDTVAHGTTGLLVPPGKHVELADAVTGLLADPERIAAYGREGRARAVARYGWETVAEGVERVYERVADRVAEPAPVASGSGGVR
ncbi:MULTISPECIES: glycosyltransferase [Streptomyces]|uniref:glycosyltransferase n=1 Tax=Streptomyces TaxID=1883 RepID=UPI00163CB7A0|nr:MULTISPECIES: glycosyltransferase [Streptomyces]MBC2879017.1 glycosyltransferase [Streptomyces sp. TYQ1024]UBI40634.1 glycosyltransferase [Streptomyces mobaraensis]UKW33216.1 glycosyltransferase [Streptomyces sp. TYQ1024]